MEFWPFTITCLKYVSREKYCEVPSYKPDPPCPQWRWHCKFLIYNIHILWKSRAKASSIIDILASPIYIYTHIYIQRFTKHQRGACCEWCIIHLFAMWGTSIGWTLYYIDGNLLHPPGEYLHLCEGEETRLSDTAFRFHHGMPPAYVRVG